MSSEESSPNRSGVNRAGGAPHPRATEMTVGVTVVDEVRAVLVGGSLFEHNETFGSFPFTRRARRAPS